MTKTIRIDFYRVECPADVSFANILRRARRLPLDGSRTLEISGKHFRLQELHLESHLWEGETVHIRMDLIPAKASLDGQLGSFDLEDDEGIGEETAFLYDDRLNVLVLQRNRYGVSSASFCRYFERIGQLDDLITLTPVIQPEAFDRMMSMQIVRKLDVKLARLNNMPIDGSNGASTSSVIDMINYFSAPSAHISISMGHQRQGSLRVPSIHEFVQFMRGLSGNPDGELRSLKISGSEGETEPQEVVDLIEDRMVATATVEPDSDRRVPYGERQTKIRQAWEDNLVQLRQMFG